ncbi:FtsX-like permease family protein [Paenibacillus sp. CN-4]|uniref:FtsX-like permease family protein n=1 Tax=Paenibacillus nanchangensis TaxID=3348343 RepID=UPI00397DB717
MSLMKLMFRNLLHRRFLSLLTVCAVALTVAFIVLFLLSRESVEQGAEQGYGPYDLVIGAEGSETQLVLNTFYHIGAPTGNVPAQTLDQVRSDEGVKAAYAMTTGDNYKGFPVVGLDAEYFLTRYGDRSLQEGFLYGKTGEAVIGYYAARELGLKPGDTFTGSHGLVQDEGHGLIQDEGQPQARPEGHSESQPASKAEAGIALANGHESEEHMASGTGTDSHESADHMASSTEKDGHESAEHIASGTENDGHESADHMASGTEKDGHESAEHMASGTETDSHGEGEAHSHASFVYTVVGILPPLNTPDDRAIFTTVDYAWAVHGLAPEERELTAILVQPSSLLGVHALKESFEAGSGVQAVYTSKAVSDVLNVVDQGSRLLEIVSGLCVLLAALTILLSLVAAAGERTKDAGLLRLLGKSKSYVWTTLVGEGLLLTATGLLIGMAAGHLGAFLLKDTLFAQTGIQLAPFHWTGGHLAVAAGTLAIGLLSSALPAFKLYRLQPLSLFKS